MKWTGLNELREEFLAFFEGKEHQRLPSFPLVPKDDNSLLLINSGMAPMKKFFVGEVTPPAKRVTTSQKCIRNNDIENVGITSRHLTYFEMLGNFSFGDYFKEQAIIWAWEFFTEVLEIPEEILYISVYKDDDEAYDIWTKKIGIDPKYMVRLGKEDNFWEHGTGPCGPSSEIYFDRGEENGCGDPSCAPGCDCDRFVEVGNIVFSQFDSDGKGTYTPLESPNIDFGMGLERLALVIQGEDNVFAIDTMRKITEHVEKIAGVTHGSDANKDVSLKVITDHIRSITFMIGDGVLGSNEGRGYVLRRLIRRAARHGKLLGINGACLYEVADTVIEENKLAYPELKEKQEMIKRVIKNEEENFAKTIDQGLEILSRLMDRAEKKFFSGDDAFLLNDTYGFPLDLTKEILSEKDMEVDENRFKELMTEQKERARSARKNAGAEAWAGEGGSTEGLPETVFTGYNVLKQQAKVLAIIKAGEKVSNASADEEITIVLDKTPFYAESGGQVADTGVIESEDVKVAVIGATKTAEGIYLHRAVVEEGMIQEGMSVTAEVDSAKREAIKRNHTAAHLLQAALRKTLGDHVEQAGQMVDENRVRFDFTHFSALTHEEIVTVEKEVNNAIFNAISVDVQEMPIAKAKEIGAMALFGEKYGDVVRVVAVDGVSAELCGGTHASNTANVGLFKILSESSVASGVRRIEGVTGAGVLKLIDGYVTLLSETASALKANNFNELPAKAAQINSEMHEKAKLLEKADAKMAAASVEGLFENTPEIDGVKIITAFFSGTSAETLKTMCDKIREKEFPVLAVIAGSNEGKVTIVATASKAAQEKGIKAGQVVKEVAILTGGNGGGRPDFAMAGAKDMSKIESALSKVADIIKGLRK